MFAYSDKVQFYFNQALARENNDFLPSDQKFYCGQIQNSSLNVSLNLYFNIENDGKIAAVDYRVYGNPALIALAHWFCEQVPGLYLQQLQPLNPAYCAAALCLPPERSDAAMILIQAVQSICLAFAAKASA